MNYFNIFIIAVALSLDAVAVAAANGAKHHKMKVYQAVRIAFFFGFFQFLMPIVGWLLGSGVIQYIANFDHWVAFSLLSILGLKMIIESTKDTDEKSIDIHNYKILFLLSIATSIDALVVGLTLALLSANVLISAIIIGVVTFIFSLIGVYAGKKFGEHWGKKSEMAGGIILILIGIKILTSHLLS